MKKLLIENLEYCMQNEKAFCTAVCPFQLDVIDFIKKLEQDRFNAAFRTYHTSVGFPAIVSSWCEEPCRNVCIRKDEDSAISLRLLEKAALENATRTTPNNFNLPAKDKHIAIIGAGISGLACALRLCGKKYSVTLYEMSDRVGGHLWDELPTKLFLDEIEKQFMYEKYTLLLNSKVISINEMRAKFDAIYIATGLDGDDFGLQRNHSGAFASNIPGIFLGGGLVGSKNCEVIADGLQAVNPIIRYLKARSMNSPAQSRETHLNLDIEKIEHKAEVLPLNGTSYTKLEAIQEAERCLQCSCDACIRYCDLLHHSKKFPKKLADEVEATINPGTMAGDGTIATRLISTCNHCGLCKEVCPQDIDVGTFLLQSHRIMTQKGAMPWAYHDFWLRDMEFCNSNEVNISATPYAEKNSKFMYFPGCQLGGSEPKYVTESYRLLLEYNPRTALMLMCCGAPAEWAGDEDKHSKVINRIREGWVAFGKPTVVFACPSCKQMFDTYLPEIHSAFLYNIILAHSHFPDRRSCGETVSVFDPCSSRYEPELQLSVRSLTENLGFNLLPLETEGKLAKCCSWGGQISIANPEYTKEIVRLRIEQNNSTYITYCVNCRDVFAAAKKPVFHILDLVLGLQRPDRLLPTHTERRQNRIQLKDKLLSEFFGEESTCEEKKGGVMSGDKLKQGAINLKIKPEIKKDLHQKMILEMDMETVVSHCEKSGKKVINPTTGHFSGHLVVGFTTFWVEYMVIEDGFELIKGYSHRMTIEEE